MTTEPMAFTLDDRRGIETVAEAPPRWQRFGGGRRLAPVSYRRRVVRAAAGTVGSALVGAALILGDGRDVQASWPGVASRATALAHDAVGVANDATRSLATWWDGIVAWSRLNDPARGPAPVPRAPVVPVASPTAPVPPTATPIAAATPASGAPTGTPLAIAIVTVTPALLPAPATPRPAPPVPAGPISHQVVAGDTLWVIAARYGTSVDAIVRANRVADADAISPGVRLVIPR